MSNDKDTKAETGMMTKELFRDKYEDLWRMYNDKSPGTIFRLFDEVVAPMQQELELLRRELEECKKRAGTV